MENNKAWGGIITGVASLLWALTTVMRCAAEEENYQRAIQALADIALK